MIRLMVNGQSRQLDVDPATPLLCEEPADEAQLKSLLAPYPSDSMVC